MNDTFETFKPLFDSGDLTIINRVGISNHSRGHDIARLQLTSSDAQTEYSTSEGLIGRLSKFENNSLRNIAINTRPYIYRGGKYVGIGSAGLMIQNYGSGLNNEQKENISQSIEQIITNRNYPGLLASHFHGALDLDNVGTIAKASEINRDGAGSQIEDKLDFLSIAFDNDLGSTFYTRGNGGYDTHRDQLVPKKEDEEGYLNRETRRLAEAVSSFYNSVKDNHDVTIVIMSEFGRTLKVNGSNGTDHGQGGGYFILSNNESFQDELDENIYGEMNLEKEKSNWLSVGIDYRSVFVKILTSLYDVSEDYFEEVFDFEGYIKPQAPKIYSLRTEFKRYNNSRPHARIKFSVADSNFKLYDGSNVIVKYGSDPENLQKYSQWKFNNYIRTSQWEDATSYVPEDQFTLDFHI
ncbi:MAG: DUF1501 domain-containing protein, partial [Patescibacteria group bacterium]|nr:DUF1501 domain-containing protein [Patescibacteria group bacterium]